MTVLCMASCARKGHHLGACVDETCSGCEPWPAADGWRLCLRCGERIGSDAVETARLYDELALVLAGGGNAVGEKTSGSKTSIGLSLSDTAVERREAIRNELTTLTRIIADERGVTLPTDIIGRVQVLPPGFIGPANMAWAPADLPAVARFIAKHSGWLAAHPSAGDVADGLSGLARSAAAVAYPSGARRFIVGPCPRCDGELWAILRDIDSELPARLTCSLDPEHGWPADQWRQLRKVEVA